MFPDAFRLLLVACLASVSLAHGGDAKKDLLKLKGDWSVSEFVVRGLTVNDLKGTKVVFTEEHMSFVSPKTKRAFTFKLDATKKPAVIEMVALDGPYKGQTAHGIYAIDGDSVKLCMPDMPSKTRPAEFTAPTGTDLMLLVLKRGKQ